MALSDKITGQFRPKTQTQTQRPYLPTIIRDAAPARPPVAQPPAQRTPMPPTSSHTPTPTWQRGGTPMPPGEYERQEQRQALQAERLRPTPGPRDEMLDRFAWEQVYQREIPSAQTFAQRVQRQADLSPNVDWNKYQVYYEPLLLNDNIGGQYLPQHREIDVALPYSEILLHEYGHAYDIDRDPGPYPDISSQPAFTRDYQTTIRYPWLFAEQHPTYDQEWYRRQVDALIKNVPYQGDPAEMYARLAPLYAQSPYNVPAQLRPYIAPMFRDQPLPPPPYPYPRPVPTPRPLLAR